MMKATLFLTTLILLTSPAAAAVYKCTDANGQVSFSDKPCADQRQEVMQVRSERAAAGSNQDTHDDSGFQIEPIEQLTGGQGVNPSSPLARAYLSFIGSLNRCDRDEIAKQMPTESETEILLVDDIELKQVCMLLSALMPANFDGATEAIDGDSGRIQWLVVESTTDADGTSTMTSEMTAQFKKEGGEWKFAGN